jgi:nucleotide-binding universal stress UspA family protein
VSDNQPTPTQNRIVVGVDGSPLSQQALRWAHFLARATGSTIEAVITWEPLAASYGGAPTGWKAVPYDQNVAEDAHSVLVDTLTAVFGEQLPPGLQTTVREGSAAKILLDVSSGARMLVLGSRGHGGFAGLLLGSVSAACAEHATCPVLVVHGTTPPPPA